MCTHFGERPKTNVIIGVPKAAHQEVQGADIAAMEEEGGVHTTKEEYKADEVLRTRMVVARKEDSPADLIDLQKLQRKELEKFLYQVLEEKFVKSEPLVYSSKQQVIVLLLLRSHRSRKFQPKKLTLSF